MASDTITLTNRNAWFSNAEYKFNQVLLYIVALFSAIKINASFWSLVVFFKYICFEPFYTYYQAEQGISGLGMIYVLIEWGLIVILYGKAIVDLTNLKAMNTGIYFSFFLLILVASITVCSNFFHGFRYYGQSIGMDYIKVIYRFSVFWIIGYHFLKNFETKYWRVIFIAVYIIITLNVFLNINPKTYLITISDKKFRWIYILMGDTYAILSIMIIALMNRKYIFSIFMISSACLFFLKSRGSLYSFVLASMPLLYLKLRAKIFVYGAFVLLALIFSYDMMSQSSFVTLLTKGTSRTTVNRMIAITDVDQDKSAIGRIELLKSGWIGIKNNWLLGDYAGQIIQYGDFGYYIHNYLSFWRQYGFVPFITLFILLIYYYLRISFDFIRNIDDKIVTFLFYYTTFVIVEIIFARAFGYSYIWFSLSAIPAYYLHKKRMEMRNIRRNSLMHSARKT